MTRVFLCHASEDQEVAEAVHIALVTSGHKVFFGERTLPPGGDYQRRILAAIRSARVFVFLASKASLAPGRYTLTELRFASDKWPSPVDRVLTVVLPGVDVAGLPPYLKAATVLKVQGNTAAEVRAAVDRIRVPWLGTRAWPMVAGAGLLAAVAAAIVAGVPALRAGFPPGLDQIRSAELRVSEVDDVLRLTVNGAELPLTRFGQEPGPVEIKHLLRRGRNTIKVEIDNGAFGGCGARVELWINGSSDARHQWHWFKEIDQAPANGNCFTVNKALDL